LWYDDAALTGGTITHYGPDAIPGRSQPHNKETELTLTTTPTIEGKSIRDYRGIVTGEAIIGANIFKDFFAGIRDIVGGRSAAYEAELRSARELALQEMAEAARQQGGNAVVGIDLDYEVVGQGGSMLMVCASGTAVTVD
jgi:uncharacterized protein YbjQ (UPF0145 family)